MSHHTRRTVQRLEAIFEELGYVVRYERGSFQSGYCIVEDRKIVVINKFFDTDGRVQTMLEILQRMDLSEATLDEKSLTYLQRHQAPQNATTGS